MVPSPKTTRWQMTVYEGQQNLLDSLPDDIAEWGWQDEICPETGRKHRQGQFRTQAQKTRYAMTKILPGIHLEPARDWNALVQYCNKQLTRDLSGNQIVQVNNRRFLKFHEALHNIARHAIEQRKVLTDQEFYDMVFKNKQVEYQQWYGVSKCLEEHEEDISLYSNPQLYRAWCGTSNFWLDKVAAKDI